MVDHSELFTLAERWFPDASLGQFRLPEGLSFVASHGLGSKIYDASGQEYIDYVLGSGPLILGHAHPSVVGAVSDQLQRGSTFYVLNEQAILLADEICHASRCAERIRFTNSGSEATYAALRFAKAYSGREKILKFEGAFHGGHDAALMSLNPMKPPPFPEAVPDSAGISRSVQGEILIAPFNDLETARRIIEANRQSLACVIVEPLQRYLSPVNGFLQGLREITNAHGILLVYDEVVTGFRLAYGGAQEYYGVTPDLVAYGKLIGGGFPIGAVCGRRDILDLCSAKLKGSSQYVYQGGTFSGNPISTAAGLATLAELRKAGSYSRLHALGNKARKGLRCLFAEKGHPVQVLGDGPLLQILFAEKQVTDYRSSLQADKGKALQFHQELFRRGMFVNPFGSKMYLSLAHTEEDLARLFEASRSAVRCVS